MCHAWGNTTLTLHSAGLTALIARVSVLASLSSRIALFSESDSTPAVLLLLSVATDLRRLSRQQNQRQPPWSPDLLSVDEIAGAHARHDAISSRSAKDPRPKSPWIRHLKNPPEQPGRKRRGPSLATTGPPRKQPLMCLLPPRLALSAEESVFMDPQGPTIAPRRNGDSGLCISPGPLEGPVWQKRDVILDMAHRRKVGRLQQGLRSAVRGQTDFRSLVRRGVGPAHQLTRNASSVSGLSGTCPAGHSGTTCASMLRQ